MSPSNAPNASNSPSGLNTKATNTRSNLQSSKLALANPDVPIYSVEEARKCLITQGYMSPNLPLTLSYLAEILKTIAPGGAVPVLRTCTMAIGVLLSDSIVPDTISKAISTSIDRSLDALKSKAEHLSNSLLSNTALDHLDELPEKLENAATHLITVTDALTSRIDRVSENTVDILHRIEVSSEDSTRTNPTGAKSYAAIVSSHTPAPSPRAAKADMQSRRVLIEKAPDTSSESWDSLSHRVLVEKANQAFEYMVNDLPVPSTAEAVSATRLNKGGVLLEFESTETATFVRSNAPSFSAAMGGTTVVKSKEYVLIAEFVPVSHDPSSQDELRQIELRSQLPSHSVTSTKWIKPLGRRTAGQQNAHLIVRLTSAQAANTAICTGLVIACKRVQARRIDPDPIRCHKCQKYDGNHTAQHCSGTETCATCGSVQHSSRECKVSNPDEFYCVSCNVKGHASWSRECKTYLHETSKLKQRKGNQSSYWFFPSTEEWTWQTKEKPIQRPSNKSNSAPNFTYQRLDWAAEVSAAEDEAARKLAWGQRMNTATAVPPPTATAGPAIHPDRLRGISPELAKIGADGTQGSTTMVASSQNSII